MRYSIRLTSSIGSAARFSAVGMEAMPGRVSTGPGATQQQRMPYWLPYCASERTRPFIAALLAQAYATLPLPPPSQPVMEPMHRMVPLFCSRICFITAWAK